MEFFHLSPWIALGVGALTALGSLRSLALSLLLGVFAFLAQVVTWQAALGMNAGPPLTTLILASVVAPYTVIGSVAGNVALALARRAPRPRRCRRFTGWGRGWK